MATTGARCGWLMTTRATLLMYDQMTGIDEASLAQATDDDVTCQLHAFRHRRRVPTVELRPLTFCAVQVASRCIINQSLSLFHVCSHGGERVLGAALPFCCSLFLPQTSNKHHFNSYHYFYRAMHNSAKRGIAIACRPSVRL